MYIEQITEARKGLKEIWSMYHDSDKEDWNRRLRCLSEIREQARYLTRLYDCIPDLAGLKPINNEPPVMSQFQDAIVRKAKTLKEQEFEDEALF
ncbi:hypothetical protein BH18THE2_BH18THE2_31280 [soil metagenome]